MKELTAKGLNYTLDLATPESRDLKVRFTANLWRFPGGLFVSSYTHSLTGLFGRIFLKRACNYQLSRMPTP
jgi:hypothetical protein